MWTVDVTVLTQNNHIKYGIHSNAHTSFHNKILTVKIQICFRLQFIYQPYYLIAY